MANLKDYKTNIKEIVFSDEEEKSFCDIFVYEPENIEEKSLGNLYIVGEVVNLPDNSSYIVNLLASIIKKEFYSNKKRSTLESLEASLNKVNSTLSDITEQGNVDWIGNLNMTCAAHCQKELHLSQTGKIKSLLIRNGQITDIGKGISSENNPHPFKTFSNIASGELEINDLILIATPGFFNVLSTEKIRQLSESFQFEELVDRIQDFITKESNLNTIATLLVQLESRKEEAHIPQVQAFPAEKTAEIIMEKKIAQPMSLQNDMLPIHEKETVNNERISLDNIIKEFEVKEEKPVEIDSRPEHAVFSDTDTPLRIAPESQTISSDYTPDKQDVDGQKHLQECPQEINVPSVSRSSVSSKIEASLRTLWVALKRTTSNINTHIKKPEIDVTKKLRLIRNSKIVFSVIVFIFIVLLGNVVITNYNNQIETEKQLYTDLIIESQKKIDEAEWLVINDPEKARASLNDAKVIAIKVRDEYKKLSAESELLLEKIQTQTDRIDKILRISDPVTLTELGSEKTADASRIIALNGKNYIINGTDTFYVLNLETGATEEIRPKKENINEDVGLLRFATGFEKTKEIIILTNKNKLLSFDTEKNTLKMQDISFKNDTLNIKDLNSYSNFIYFLDSGYNQIYKYKKNYDAFAAESDWLNEKENIKDSVSMTIDTNIYILKSNGSIEYYIRGIKQKFSVENISDPALNPTKIYTKPELKNFYIADPLKNRIIIFDKEKGNLQKQLVVNDFNNSIKDLTADSKEEILFVLSGAQIYKLDLMNGLK